MREKENKKESIFVFKTYLKNSGSYLAIKKSDKFKHQWKKDIIERMKNYKYLQRNKDSSLDKMQSFKVVVTARYYLT